MYQPGREPPKVRPSPSVAVCAVWTLKGLSSSSRVTLATSSSGHECQRSGARRGLPRREGVSPSYPPYVTIHPAARPDRTLVWTATTPRTHPPPQKGDPSPTRAPTGLLSPVRALESQINRSLKNLTSSVVRIPNGWEGKRESGKKANIKYFKWRVGEKER